MSDRHTIVHLSTATTWRGGEQQALYLARGLQQCDVPTLVVAQPESPMRQRCAEAGLRAETLRMRGEWDILAAWQLSRLLKRERAILVHAHDAHGVSLAARAGRWAGCKRICTRRVDFKLNSARKYRRLDHVICISRAILDICAEAGVPREMMSIVPSGIDLDRIRNDKTDTKTVRRELGEEKEKRLIVLNVASLTDHKGQKYLVEAMPDILMKVPQALFVIVGAGELEQELKIQARQLALDTDVLVFTGFRDDVPGLLRACDLFVMSSHLEGLCTSVMDAMAAGKAVVATDAGGLPEIVAHEQTGLIIPAKSPQALVEAVVTLLKERKRRLKLGEAGARKALSEFGFERMVEKTRTIYEQLAIIRTSEAIDP